MTEDSILGMILQIGEATGRDTRPLKEMVVSLVDKGMPKEEDEDAGGTKLDEVSECTGTTVKTSERERDVAK